MPAGAFLLFLLFYHLHILLPVESVAQIATSRIQVLAVQSAVAVSSHIKAASASKQKLIRDIADQETKINTLSGQLIHLRQTEKENADLRLLLQFKQQNDYQLLPATIIYKSTIERGKKIILNKGSNDGAQVNDAVIINSGILIGKIIEVKSNSSAVRLTIDSSSSIFGTLDNSPDIIAGVIKGTSGTGLQLTLIPKTISLKPGDRVITNGLQEQIPRSLYIGEITALEESENAIFNTALVKPPYTIENLFIAAIIVQ